MKKVLSACLATALAFGISAPAAASSTVKVTDFATVNGKKMTLQAGMDGSIKDAVYSTGSPAKYSISGQNVYYRNDLVPHDKNKEYIDLFAGMFVWENRPSSTKDSDRLSSQIIRSSRLGVRIKGSNSSKYLDTVKIDNRNARIEIKYKEEYVSTKVLDFEFDVYLTFNGSRKVDQGLTYIGSFANDITDVYDDDDYVDLSGGQVAYADDYNGNVEVDLGNGVFLFAKMYKNKLYYGTASRTWDYEDDAILEKYPDIDHVIELKTIGLSRAGDIVKLETDYDGYYVYNAYMEYLGKSNQMMPYYTKYYLANRELNVSNSTTSDGEAPEIM